MANDIDKFKKDFNWEDKARINPLYAIMSDSVFKDSGGEPTEEELRVLYSQGKKFWNKWFAPLFWDSDGTQDLVLLEYGCGMGRIINYPAKNFARCYGVDISEVQIDFARRYCPNRAGVTFLTLRQHDHSIPLEDDTVDVVCSYAVLQHIEKRISVVKAVSEMARVLKKKGKIKLQIRTTNGYLSGGKRVFYKSFVFEGHTLVFYFRRISFLWIPVIRIFKHNNWSGAGSFFDVNALIRLLKKNAIRTNAIEFDIAHNVVWIEGCKI